MKIRQRLAQAALGVTVLGAVVVPTGAAFAVSAVCDQASPSNETCEPEGETVVRGNTVEAAGTQADPSELAFTGGDVAGLTAIGAGIAGAGALAVVGARRRRIATDKS